MKWEAACMRRSAASQSCRAVAMSPAPAARRAECVEGEDFDVGVVVEPGVVEDRHQSPLCAGDPVGSVHCRQQAFTERSLFSTARSAMPRSGRVEHRSCSSEVAECTKNATEMDPGERGQAYVTGGLGLVDRQFQGGGAGVVVARLTLRSSQTGQLVRLRLPKAQSPRRIRRTTEVNHGIVEPMLDASQLAEHRVPANVKPRVVDPLQPDLHVSDGVNAAPLVTGGDRGPRGEEAVRSPIPRPVEPLVQSIAAIGQLQRVPELTVVRHDVGEVVRATGS